jgi:hypothetical protein
VVNVGNKKRAQSRSLPEWALEESYSAVLAEGDETNLLDDLLTFVA